MKCPACNAIIPAGTEICPACFSSLAPVAPPRESAPSRPPQEQVPPREARPASPSRPGRSLSPRILLPAGIGALVIILAIVAVTHHRAPVPPVAASAPVQGEKTTSITDMPAKPAAPVVDPAKAPTPDKKAVAKKAPSPRKKPVVKEAQPTPKSQWTYNPAPQAQAPKPAPAPEKKGGIAGLLDRALGPERPVTPPPPPNDARGTGM